MAIVPHDVTEPPPGYPTDWIEDVVLRDGTVVRVRPILPDDAPGLEDLVGRMSVRSTYFRFFRVKRALEPEELERFTHLDYDRRMAFVVVEGGRIRGVGRYDALRDEPSVAEVAFAVADADQNRGIGTLLLNLLAAYAREHGISAFRAHVLADNRGMMRVFRNAGLRLRRELEEGVYTVEFSTAEDEAVLEAEAAHEREAIVASLLRMFYPNSVAVIGASRDPHSIGGRLFANLVDGDFTGPVYPVNPRTRVVRSVAAYPSILDVPDTVDLAFVVVPAPLVLDVVRDCADKGVRGLVVISAGFGETGPEGRRREAALLELVREAGMRMIGPNCMGIINTDPAVRLDGQFGPVRPPRGNVAISSQSGALGLALLDYANDLNIGISHFVSVGNAVDVSANDLLLYWEDDPATDVILLYVESFGHPRRFGRLARRVARRKPIVAVKSGRTVAGARAASSHTGSLASRDVAVDALFRQAGVIRVDTLEGLFDVTALLANQPLPEGNRVAVVTNGGGPGILAVDALAARGLEVPELSEELQGRLRARLSPDAAVANPVDMIAAAGPDEYRHVLELLFTSDEIDAIMAIYIPASPEGSDLTVAAIREVADRHYGKKTFQTVYMRSEGAPVELSGHQSRVPAYPFPERAARALAAAVERTRWLERPQGVVVRFEDVDADRARRTVAAALERLGPEGGWLDPDEANAILAAYRLQTPPGRLARTPEEAVAIAREIGGPVVLKVVAASVLHKSDVGGVVVGVEGDDAVREAYRRVVAVAPDAEGALVQAFVPGGHEVLVGMVEDPNFGPLLVFGLGGVFVELIGDVAFRINPITDVDADEMIREVRAARLLEGYRGAEPGDVPAVRELLLRVSSLVEDLPEITEMDLNPVKVGAPGEGAAIVDARIRVAPAAEAWRPSRIDRPFRVDRPTADESKQEAPTR
ncbi:MAG TPA: GNAT family N-acetyltransferase [Actinobacteria bacterium]|nr:GNAT family N-acetyltransferase [Actinomycetota bacterium]